MSLHSLANKLALFLEPFLPYLVETGDETSENTPYTTEPTNDLKLAKAVWDRLHQSAQHDLNIDASLRGSNHDNDESKINIILCDRLEILLRDDPLLAHDIDQLLSKSEDNRPLSLGENNADQGTIDTLSPEAISAWKKSNRNLSLLEFLSTIDGRHDR